jgi:hypothetical protein
MVQVRLQIGWAVVCLVAGAAGRAEAGTIVEYTAGANAAANLFTGQSVTTPAGGPFNNITFNFFSDTAATTPSAAGDLFILTQQYLGNPDALSSATPGFLAESTGVSGGIYQFDPSVTLQGGTQYFFYTDALFQTAFVSPGTYAGGILYSTTMGNSPYVATGGDATFRLSGTTVGAPVPEPWTAVGAVTGAVCVLAYARLRRGRERWRSRPTGPADAAA